LIFAKALYHQRRIRSKLQQEKNDREQLRNEKAYKYHLRCQETVKRLKKEYRNKQANRIRRSFIKYRDKIHELWKADQLAQGIQYMSSSIHNHIQSHYPGLDGVMTTDKSEISIPILQQAKAIATKAIIAPIETAVTSAIQAVESIAKPYELIPKRDEKKLVNAVLQYQVKTILQEGIIDLQVTVSEIETKATVSEIDTFLQIMSSHQQLSDFL
jgi:hypothetical protein